MKVRKQVVLTEETWAMVQDLTNKANDGFDLGFINYSDTINAMILSAKTDVDTLRARHTDVKRALRSWASKKDVDLDALIKDLSALQGKSTKKKPTATNKDGV